MTSPALPQSFEYLVGGDGQAFYSHADRIVDSVGDCRGRRYDGRLCDALGAIGAEAGSVLDEDGFDLWSMGRDSEDNEGKEGSDDIKNWIEK